MKSKHYFDKPFKLYHLSKRNLDGKLLVPRPMDPETVMEGENWRLPRICVATSIDGCVSAIVDSMLDPYGLKLWVHVPIDLTNLFISNNVYRPSTCQVPDAEVTGEHWLKAPAQFKAVGQIEITDVDLDNPLHYKWYGEDAIVYRYKWHWVTQDIFNNVP